MSPPSPIPTLSPRPAPSDFFQGFALVGRALRLILRSSRLLGLSLLCAALTLVSLLGLLVLVWRHAPDLLGTLWAQPEAWYGQLVWYLVLALTGLVLLVVGLNLVLPLVLAPFQDTLSEHTEELCGGYTSPPFRLGAFLRGLVTSVAHALARLSLLLAGLTLLLPLHLFPGVGSVAWTVLGTGWTMLWLAAEHLAAPMTRHQYPFSDIRRVLRERRLLCLGFGASIYLLFWLPLINTFFVPVAIVGGTLLYRGLLATGTVPPPPDARAEK